MVRYVLAALSGTLYFLGFAGFGIWPLSFVALVPLLWALDPLHPPSPLGRAQLWGIGLTSGLVLNLGGYYWLVEMLENFSGFPFALCLLFAVILCAYQGVVMVIFAFLYRRGREWGLSNLVAATAAMCVAEVVWPRLFDHYFGASLHDLPITIQIADIGGPLLVTGLLTAANAGIYTLSLAYRAHRVDRREVAIAAGLWVFTLGYGAYRVREVDERAAAAPKLSVGLVQANMGLMEKRNDPEEGLRRHIEQSVELERKHKLDLLVWPESAFGWFLPPTVTDVRSIVLGDVIRTPVLFGGLARRELNGEMRPFNTAFLTDKEGHLKGSYDKIFLLAFGEYIPLGDTFPVLYDWSPNSGRFAKGQHTHPVELGPYRLSVLICYEDILPVFVRGVVREANPHLLVNLTNDAWFGDTHAPWEHLALAQLRSAEHHRALVRATNSGVSAVIDPVGRMVTHGGTFTRESLHAEVPMMQGTSIYQYVGDFPGWLSALVLGGAYFRARRRHKLSEPQSS